MADGIDQNLVNERQGKVFLSKLLDNAIRNKLMDVHTCMPGVINTFHSSDNSVDVQLLFQREYNNGNIVTYPVIPHVPLLYLGPANGWVRWPVTAGDPVLVIFSERAIGQWFSTGTAQGAQLPEDSRIFDLTDAIAIPGLRDSVSPVVPQGDSTSAEFVYKNARVEITSGSLVKIANATQSLKTALNDLANATAGAQIVVTGASGVISPSSQIAINNALAEINQILG